MFLVTVATLLVSLYDAYFDKGALASLATGLLPWFGIFNGYVAARFYTFFNGSSWSQLACCTSFFLPAIISGTVLLIDVCEWIESGRADTLPVRDACLLAAYWFFIHFPLSYMGSYYGFVRQPIQAPIKKNRMRRETDADRESGIRSWLRISVISPIASLVPMLMAFIQIWQVLDSVNGPANITYLHWMFYIVFALFIIVVIEMGLIINFIVLSNEQPHWWWRVWWGCAYTGVYVFAVMMLYFVKFAHVQYVTQILAYAIAAALVGGLVSLMTASVAMIFAFRFNLYIYS